MDRPYKLWLDDERPAPAADWVVCKNREEFENTIRVLGMPYCMALDHDLGNPDPNTTGMAGVKWLYEAGYNIAQTAVSCHSDNFDGKKNILTYIENWRKHV